MYLMLIGSALALTSVFLMQSSERLIVYSGMLLLIVGIFLAKKGRDKVTNSSPTRPVDRSR